MRLLIISIAPVIIIASYIYIRDKYEREPWKVLLAALVSGMLIVVPVVLVESFLMKFIIYFENIGKAAYNAFIVAGFTEELFKFLAFIILIWKSKEFNEKFDGIVYSVFISLGFALVENIMYVFENGYSTGIVRAVTAVPAHALFGVIMGYYFGSAKFYPTNSNKYLFAALIYPIILHGIYDFMLMSQHKVLLFLFIPYLIYLWVFGFRKMKYLSDRSVFRTSLGSKKRG